MHAKERVSEHVVKRYEDSICFMVDTYSCQMEATYPRTSWVMPMGYEVEEYILIIHVDNLLFKPIDPSIPRFGTFKEKSVMVHNELAKPVVAKKIRKEV